MINTYQYYSKGFACNVQVSYKDGKFYMAEIDSPELQLVFSEANPANAKCYFFVFEEGFLEATKANKTVTKIVVEISFEMFWNKYDYKLGRHEAERSWKNLSKKDQQEAYEWIPVYNSQLKQTPVARLHGASYLNKKRWIK